ncbi:hypothetical protein [Desulfobulbus alkaliphilus]|uniref:hypothetical protein n=1 Tax=Desulfobulbus alkaliphilus TaxID=869814 RepID=UPI001962EEE1|nr:hypothetical protein [Desulfobulbus alkaliphilus]MBM9536161.1 hypothetical protein [Desulfobulbus alkaliphilus]
MLPSEHMDTENTVTLDGTDIETINFGLEKIDQAQKTCSMLNMILLAMNDREAQRAPAIKEVLNHWLLQAGIASTLELVGAALREAEGDITTMFERNVVFSDPDVNRLYDHAHKRKPAEG